MSMWDYLAAHPWWGLVYLVVVCFTVMATFSYRRVTIKDIDVKDVKRLGEV